MCLAALEEFGPVKKPQALQCVWFGYSELLDILGHIIFLSELSILENEWD